MVAAEEHPLARLWELLKDETTRRILSFLGAGAAVIIGGLWAVLTFFVAHEPRSQPSLTTTSHSETLSVAPSQGIGAGRDVFISGPVQIGPTSSSAPAGDDKKPLEKSSFLIRIFKAEATLELWNQEGTKLRLLKTIPLCRFGGNLGKKTIGDRQTPEGFYEVAATQYSRIPDPEGVRALLILYPNNYEQQMGVFGFGAQIISGCASGCCIALTDKDYQYLLEHIAGEIEKRVGVPLHVFPFRMDESAFSEIRTRKDEITFRSFKQVKAVLPFWRMLQGGYSFVELNARIPEIYILDKRYVYRDRGSPPPPGAIGLY
jgi:murein L,D-transpeptidase YafK